MMRTVLASAALVAAANAIGDAIVVNKCSYDVYMANTPASGGGYSAVDQTLSSGASYSQQYTELSNGNGWSIKLSKAAGQFGSNILQYEYTFHNDGTIWYDLSEVNGNPWDGNWEITASSGCTPRQAAYRYATDDAYGMQACGDTATITVTLCSGDAAGGSSPPPASSPSQTWAPTSAAPAPSTPAAPETTTAANKNHNGHHTWGFGENKVKAPAGDVVLDSSAPAPVASTPAATPSEAWNGPAVTVTNVHMETMTKYVTATAAPAKRHVHHARHPHHRR